MSLDEVSTSRDFERSRQASLDEVDEIDGSRSWRNF